MLREAREVGEIHPGRDLALARMFLFGALNWSVEWYDPEKGTLDDFAREAAQTFLHGISDLPGRAGDRHIARPGNTTTGTFRNIFLNSVRILELDLFFKADSLALRPSRTAPVAVRALC